MTIDIFLGNIKKEENTFFYTILVYKGELALIILRVNVLKWHTRLLWNITSFSTISIENYDNRNMKEVICGAASICWKKYRFIK